MIGTFICAPCRRQLSLRLSHRIAAFRFARTASSLPSPEVFHSRVGRVVRKYKAPPASHGDSALKTPERGTLHRGDQAEEADNDRSFQHRHAPCGPAQDPQKPALDGAFVTPHANDRAWRYKDSQRRQAIAARLAPRHEVRPASMARVSNYETRFESRQLVLEYHKGSRQVPVAHADPHQTETRIKEGHHDRAPSDTEVNRPTSGTEVRRGPVNHDTPAIDPNPVPKSLPRRPPKSSFSEHNTPPMESHNRLKKSAISIGMDQSNVPQQSTSQDFGAINSSPKRERPIPEQQPLMSVEEDFVQRISQGRLTTAGPYSRPQLAEAMRKDPEQSQLPPDFFEFGATHHPGPLHQPLHSTLMPQRDRATRRNEIHSPTDRSGRRGPSCSARVDSRLVMPGADVSTPRRSLPPKQSIATDPAGTTSESILGSLDTPNHATRPSESTPTGHLETALPTDEQHGALSANRPTSSYQEDGMPTSPQLLTIISSKSTSIEESWTALLTLLRSGGLQDLRKSGASTELFVKFVRGWCDNRASALVLSPSLVQQRLFKLGVQPRTPGYQMAMQIMLNSVLTTTRDSPQSEHGPSIEDHCQELLALWDILMGVPGKEFFFGTVDSRTTAWQEALSSEAMRNMREWSQKGLRDRLPLFFKTQPGRALQNRDGLIMASYAVILIQLKRGTSEDMSIKAKPFVTFVSQLLTHAEGTSHYLDRRVWESMFSLENAALIIETLKKPLSLQAPAPAIEIFTSPTQQAGAVPSSQGHDEYKTMLVKRIARATEKKQSSHLDQLWKECTETMPSQSNWQKSSMTSNLYTHFLKAYMTVQQPHRAIEVWNQMLQSGVEPQMKSWDVMLRGFGDMKDPSGVEQIWQMLSEAVSKPDSRLWATRIYSLSIAGHKSLPLRAFNDMFDQWIEAAKRKTKKLTAADLASLGDLDDTPKPTQYILNALVHRLIRAGPKSKPDLDSILSRMRAIGIHPDIYTYNALLKGAFRAGDDIAVDALFTQMQAANITPDVATLTLILRWRFRSQLSEHSTPEAREQATKETLETIRSFNLPLNSWTFTTIITSLLKSPDPSSFSSDDLTTTTATAPHATQPTDADLNLAYSILHHMQHHSIPIPSVAYTTLITTHFSRAISRADGTRAERTQGHASESAAGVDDITAIDTLHHLTRHSSNLIPDSTYYDRLIEGYSELGLLPRAKMALAEAGKRGRVVGWVALGKVCRALGERGDIVGVRGVVETVSREEGWDGAPGNGVGRARVGKKFFLGVVRGLGFGVDTGDGEGDGYEGDRT